MNGDDIAALAVAIKDWGRELGFSAVGIAGTDLGPAAARLADWLAAGMHGEMAYLARQADRRGRPAEFFPGTRSVICARLDYLPGPGSAAQEVLDEPADGYVARYALGRDYHRVLRARLKRLAGRIERTAGPFRFRVCTDSAPVMEVELARLAGIGWRGKHTLLLSRQGSWFFLGEIHTDLPLPPDRPVTEHCGSCRACLEICPTRAIVAPYVLDARRCISYLTIEHPGPIPVELRPLIGNRVFGCDDCQLACPWNRFARRTTEADFAPRHGLEAPRLAELFGWSESDFLKKTEGSAIRRVGYERWLRNLAVALGNAPPSPVQRAALSARADHPSALVREHVRWALAACRT
jgi:epoxyqueuosine reductase